MRKEWASLLCGAIGALVSTFLVFLFFTPQLSLRTVSLACEGDCADADAIEIAMQLGRLDIIALVLTFLGLVIAILAIFGFIAVKEKASLEARDVAETAVKQWLNEKGPQIIGQAVSKLETISAEQMSDKAIENLMKEISAEETEGKK